MPVALTRRDYKDLADALGDAITYRIGDESEEPFDHHCAARYHALATRLGVTPSDCPDPDPALVAEAEAELRLQHRAPLL